MQLSRCIEPGFIRAGTLCGHHAPPGSWGTVLANGQSRTWRIRCRQGQVDSQHQLARLGIRCKDEGLEGGPAVKKKRAIAKTKGPMTIDEAGEKKTKADAGEPKVRKVKKFAPAVAGEPLKIPGTSPSGSGAGPTGSCMGSDVPSAEPLDVTVSNGSANSNADPSTAGDVKDNRSLKLTAHTLKIPVGGREITIETGRIGRQANAAVMVRDGDTMVYTTVCTGEEPSEPGDFLPLSVNYQERFSAAGRTSGGYFKKEGRARDHEVLVSRLIDRPIRPMIAKGFSRELQILIWVLSYDALHSPDALSIIAAGAALAVSDVPLSKPVAGVRVGLLDGEFVINPTTEQMKTSTLDMIMAGTADAVLMIEGYCNLLPEEQLLQAVQKGQEAISGICVAVEEWARAVGKPKMPAGGVVPPSNLQDKVKEMLGGDLTAALKVKGKQERGVAVFGLEGQLLEAISKKGVNRPADIQKAEEEVVSDESEWSSDEEADADEEPGSDDGDIGLSHKPLPMHLPAEVYEVAEIKKVFKEICSSEMRRLVVEEGVRSDGRGPKDIRPIDASCGLLPRVHGSALFTRGETQAIAVATLGGQSMGQKLDNMTSEDGEVKRFYLQYTFPPCSVGETGRVGGASRREVGHGQLAERALEPVLPSLEEFPYTVRVESTITESNGSSSMASVCGGCLAMLDAGVPLRTPVAGVAMGLVLGKEGHRHDPVILSDILGSEDALGDMDFKVAGDRDGVTAFQMDIKVEGITVEVMATALAQAKEGRRHILDEMEKSFPPPARQLAGHAPRIESLRVGADKVKDVIGSQGKMIRAIIEESGVEAIDIDDKGQVKIIARSMESMARAKARIEALTTTPEVGKIYRQCPVKTITMFGAFLEVAPGKEGLCHISELNTERVNKVEDFIKEGDLLDVKLLEINARGQMKLSHRVVLMEEQQGGESPPKIVEAKRAPTQLLKAQQGDVGRA